jgi:hypothetical protein
MIHLDRNPLPLDAHSQQNLLLPSSHPVASWPHADAADGLHDLHVAPPQDDTSPDHPLPHVDAAAHDVQPVHQSAVPGPSSPASRPSPTHLHSSSLSPVPLPSSPHTRSPPPAPESTDHPSHMPVNGAQSAPDKSSRQSTPLSDVPDDFDAAGSPDGPAPKENGQPTQLNGDSSHAGSTQSSPMTNGVKSPQSPQQPISPDKDFQSLLATTSSPPDYRTPSRNASGQPNGPATAAIVTDPRVDALLEINAELFKCVPEPQLQPISSLISSPEPPSNSNPGHQVSTTLGLVSTVAGFMQT